LHHLQHPQVDDEEEEDEEEEEATVIKVVKFLEG
jgi:hypothetical protein